MIVYTAQGLCNGPVSVHPSVCPVDRQQQRRAAGLLLSAGTCSRYRSIVACAGAQQQMRAASRREPGDEAQPTQTHQVNGPLSRTTRVGRHQKGKTNLDFTEARDSEWQGISWAIGKSARRSRQITMPPPLSFLQAGCLSCRPTNSVKALLRTDLLEMHRVSWWVRFRV